MSDDVADWVRTARSGDPSARAEAIGRLVGLLADDDAFVRSEAADALGPLGERSAVPGLIRALADTEPVVRASAAESLGDLADPSSMDPLIEAARADADEAVRAYAVSSLGLLGASADRLADLQAREESVWVRAEYGIARYRAGSISVDEVLRPLDTDDETLVLRFVNGLHDLLDRGAGAVPETDASIIQSRLLVARSRVPGAAADLDRLAARLEPR